MVHKHPHVQMRRETQTKTSCTRTRSKQKLPMCKSETEAHNATSSARLWHHMLRKAKAPSPKDVCKCTHAQLTAMHTAHTKRIRTNRVRLRYSCIQQKLQSRTCSMAHFFLPATWSHQCFAKTIRAAQRTRKIKRQEKTQTAPN